MTAQPIQPAQPTSVPGNPFTPMRSVPPERFYGRRLLLSEILPGLDNEMSFWVVGDARIGKTSLLHYLEWQLAKRPLLLGHYVPVYISMDAQLDQASFCRAVLRRVLPHLNDTAANLGIIRSLETRIEQEHPVSLEELQRMVKLARQADLRVVLLLDEFKNILLRPNEFGEVFLGTLRSLYADGTITLVISSRQPLIELEGLSTYFANAVSQVTLHLLTDDEADALLAQPNPQPFRSQELDLARNVGRCHPLRLQWTGYILCNARHQVPNLYYNSADQLSERAPNLLSRDVQLHYDQAMTASATRPTSVQHPGVIGCLGQAAMRIGVFADQIQAHVLGATIVLVGMLTIVLLIGYLAGWFSFEQLLRLVRLLTGASNE